MGKVRILHLRSCEGFYGAENIIFQVSKALQETTKYLPVIGIFSNDQSTHLQFADFLEKHKIHTVIFKCNGILDFKTIKSIGNYINQKKISVLHSHGYKANFYAFLANHKLNLPHVGTCYPWNDTSYSLRGKIYSWMDKKQIRWLDHIITDAETTREEILELNISSEKVTNIDNGIDLSRFDRKMNTLKVRKTLGIPEGKKVIGAVGRFTAEKGHATFISSAAIIRKKFSDVHFLLVGDGELREDLKQQVQQLGLEDIFIFTGVRNDIPELVEAMDIFVLPSFSEGMPMALLEAMAVGKAIVTTRVGSVPRIIENGRSGILVEANEQDIANGICQYLQNVSTLEKFGKEAKQNVIRNYSSRIQAERYSKIYDNLLHRSTMINERNTAIQYRYGDGNEALAGEKK